MPRVCPREILKRALVALGKVLRPLRPCFSAAAVADGLEARELKEGFAAAYDKGVEIPGRNITARILEVGKSRFQYFPL